MKAQEKIVTKKSRGRPPGRVKPQTTPVRLALETIYSVDAWIAAQPEPRPTRPEAIRRLLETALAGQRPAATHEQKIARAKRTIADNPEKGEPSPATGMATLRRGLAETKLRSLKARKGDKG